MPITAQLFDGTTLQFPDDTDPSVIQDTAKKLTLERQPKEEPQSGGIAAGKAAIENIKGAGASLLGRLGVTDAEEAEKYNKQQEEKAKQIFKPTEETWGQAPLTKFGELLGGSVPYMAAPVIGGGLSLVAPEAAVAGVGLGTIGSVLAGTAQYTGTGLQRQMQEGKKLGDTNLLAAGSAGLGEAILDTTLGIVPGVKKIFGLAGKDISESVAKNVAEKGIASTLGGIALESGKKAGEEGVTEAAQAFLERLQAGLNITDEDAKQEYYDNFLGGAILGGAFGGAHKILSNYVQKSNPYQSVLTDLKNSVDTSQPISRDDLATQLLKNDGSDNIQNAHDFIDLAIKRGNIQELDDGSLQFAQPNTFTPEVQKSVPELRKTLQNSLKRYGLQNVGLNIVDSIENGKASGAYTQNLITLALDSPNPMGEMKHESIHAIKDLGGFKDNEWQVLTNKAKDEWLDKFIKSTGKYDLYKDQYEKDNGNLKGFDDYIYEEAIAEAFKHFDATKPPAGLIGNIYYRIKQLMDTLKNGFSGHGFHTADSIFNSVEKGDREVLNAKELSDSTKYSLPEVNRIDMDYKDVTKPVPELTKGANQLQAGKITREDYEDLVNKYKPVKPYDFVPAPATPEEATNALTSDKKEKYGKTDDIEEGEQTDLRLDIPAYKDHGVWVNSIHRKNAPTVYDSVSSVKNATMIFPEEKGLKVATREATKAPFGVIRGEWNPVSKEDAVAKAQQYLNDPSWSQVGMDPERHGYFYDRKTMQPVTHADEVLQIGPLVLAKNPTFGDKKNYRYSIKAPDTPEFKKWFSDSKVVNEDGSPMVVYHASRNFQGGEFKPSPKVNRTGNPDGFYFTHDIEDANRYAGKEEGSQIIPVYLNIKNPYPYNKKVIPNAAMIAQFKKELNKEYDLDRLGEDWVNEKTDIFKEGRFPNISFPTDAFTRVIKAGGYDGMVDGRDFVAFEPNQIKSAIGNQGTYNIESPDIRYSINTPEFKKWFGNSKIVNEDGTPKVMFHGTSQNITEFKPKQANAIFLTDNPRFAESFSNLSRSYMERESISNMPKKEQRKKANKVINELFKQGIIKKEKVEELKRIPPEMILQYNSIDVGMQPELPSYENIMPLFVKAENPFDYENEDDVKKLVDYLSNKKTDPREGGIRRGSWSVLEEDEHQKAIKDLGFDGFYVWEGGNKNLAVYKPEQIKSAIGNKGTYNAESPDIRYSINTPEFKNWFGDSKAVDKNGKPLVFYHGTNQDFTTFKPSKEGVLGKGIYLTPDAEYAGSYTSESAFGEKRGTGGNVMPLFAKIVNPLVIYYKRGRDPAIQALENLGINSDKADAIINKAQEEKGNITNEIMSRAVKQGHDGIYYVNEDGSVREAVVFNPRQVKSAIGNQGTYSSESPDIRYSLSQAVNILDKKEPIPHLPRVRNIVPTNEIGKYFDNSVKEKYGKPLDYKNENDFARAVEQAKEEFDLQRKHENSGLNWYNEDIKNSFDTTAEVIPELKDVTNRQIFSVMAGILSPGVNARDNWFITAEAFKHLVKTGVIPSTNPKNGKLWQGGIQSGIKRDQLNMLNNMYQRLGKEGLRDWLFSEHSVQEVNNARREYGNFTSKIKGKANDRVIGLFAFGPKIGPFVSNINGIYDVTVDMWATRTFNRYFGTMVDSKGEINDSPTAEQREYAKKLFNEVAKHGNVKNYQAQAVLWFSEQRLFRELGAKAESYNFSDGARKFFNSERGAGETGYEVSGGHVKPSSAKYSLAKNFLFPSGVLGKDATEEGRLPIGGGVSRGGRWVPSSGKTLSDNESLIDLPTKVKGFEGFNFGVFPTARKVAEEYMSGKQYYPPQRYVTVDKERALRIAKAYEDMENNPSDPQVKRSYDALSKETLDQYQAIKDTGLKIDFIREGMKDPYASSPRLAIIDAVKNNHLWVFPTDFGYGENVSELNDPNNPLLAYTNEYVGDKQMRVNDVFRVVHDYFGHIKEGVGFRADGEENAWRSHVSMYSPLAQIAMTTETRGQNSWVNFGPHGEFNKTANGADTRYAPQKLGLLPIEFVVSGAPIETDYNFKRGLTSEQREELPSGAKRSFKGYVGTTEPTNRPSGSIEEGVTLGRKQADAKTFVGTHYSQSPRKLLNGSAYGTGIKGEEAKRLADSTDPRIKKRVYFYLTNPLTGRVHKEAGVGIHEHTQTFNNIATGKTLSNLLTEANGDNNAFESLVVDRGYDGYAVPSMNMMVLLNHDNVPVNYQGIKYSLAPSLTKLQPQKTQGQRLRQAIDSTIDNVNNNDYWTSKRVNWIDKNSSLTKSLSQLPIFNTNGQLRADMLNRAKQQSINLIKNGLLSGYVRLNSDGTLGVERSENNLARSLQIADSLDEKFKQFGKSARQGIADYARTRRGQDILEEDKVLRAQGIMNLADAKVLMKQAKALAMAGKMRESQRVIAQVKALRKEGFKLKNINREKQVTEKHIQDADRMLKAIPEIQQVMDIWRNVNESLIQLKEDTGLISKETADKYRANKNYVPLFKSIEDLEEDGFFYSNQPSGAKSTAKEFQLEGANITRNIWENVDKLYAKTVAQAYENHTRKVAVEQLGQFDLARTVDQNGKPFSPNDPRINLRYKQNGQVVHAIVDNPNDVAGFQMMNYGLSPLMKTFSTSTKFLRAGALLNPMYWVKQLIRDPIHASIVANSGIVTPLHAMRDFASIIAKNSRESKILADRGVIGSVDSTQSLSQFLKEVGKEKTRSPNKLASMLHRVMEIHEASDAATRVSVFKSAYNKAKKAGMSDEDATNLAVHKARESINFSTQGNSPILQHLRQMIPFLSASITSLDTVYRAATGYGLNAQEKAEARSLFIKRAAMLALLSTAYAMMYQQDDKYKDLPDYVKDNNWLIPSPDGKSFIKVTTPFEVGFLFKTIPETIVRYWYGTSTGKEVLASYYAGLLQNLPANGVPIPQLVKPLIENVTNHSFFTGHSIEGMSDQGLPVAMRGARASEFSKTMSGLGLDKIGLSPAKIDNLIQGYFAELGTFSTALASDVIYHAEGKEPPDKNLGSNPVLKSFLTDPNVSKAISDFYDLEGNAKQMSEAFTHMKNNGLIEDAKNLVNDEDKRKLLMSAPAYRKVDEQMRKIRQAINYYQGDTSGLSPEERRQKINELNQTLAMVAKQGYVIANAFGIQR